MICSTDGGSTIFTTHEAAVRASSKNITKQSRKRRKNVKQSAVEARWACNGQGKTET